MHFVSLAAIRDPTLVPVAVAQGIGLQDSRGGRLLEHLTDYLVERTLLLVLDNFEHVLAAAGFVDALLAEDGELRVLVTSRSPLHLSGEQEFPVPALPLPDRSGSAAAVLSALSSAESVQLFAARAAAAVPGFTVDDGNAGAVAGIVARLDGLPLAIELAAARVKLLPPAEILARLEHSLALLVSGGRDVPDRQRTGAIAWSYELLSDGARPLLAASSAFRGGIGLADIEAVGARAVSAAGLAVIECEQPTRNTRRGRGKSDPIDAHLAVLTALRLDAFRASTSAVTHPTGGRGPGGPADPAGRPPGHGNRAAAAVDVGDVSVSEGDEVFDRVAHALVIGGTYDVHAAVLDVSADHDHR